MIPAYPLAPATEQNTLPTSPRSTSLYSLVVLLGAAGQGRLPNTLGRAIHAQVLNWLQVADPAIAQAIHSTQTSPISLSGLVGQRHKHGTQPDDEFYFRISLLDGDLLQPLLAGMEAWGFPFCLPGC
jgi:CRISPR-associated endoribonuclease Cas6